MRARDYLGYTWRNVMRAQLRVLLTVLAVIIGATLVVVMTSVGGGIQRNVLEGIRAAGGLNEILVLGAGTSAGGGFGPPRTGGGLTDAVVERVAAIPGVSAVLPIIGPLSGVDLLYEGLTAQPSLTAAPSERLAAYGYATAEGTSVPAPGEIVLGARVAQRFFDANRQRAEPPALFGQSVQLTARRPGPPPAPTGAPGGLPGLPGLPGLTGAAPQPPRFERELRVVGILRELGTQDDFAAWLNPDDLLDTLEFLTGRRPDVATEGYLALRVKTASTEQVRAVQSALGALDLQATSPLSVLDQVNQGMVVLQLLLGTIGLVALIVSGLGVANTMLMATFERTREIGILKALGATEGQIARLFLLEASFIGVLGAVLGLAFGWLATQVINQVVLQLLVSQVSAAPQAPSTILYTPPWVAPIVVAFAWAIAVAAGLYPALRAANLNIARALRAD